METTYTAIVSRCPDTGMLIAQVPWMDGVHTQGDTLDEIVENLKEVIDLASEDGLDPVPEHVATCAVTVEKRSKGLD